MGRKLFAVTVVVAPLAVARAQLAPHQPGPPGHAFQGSGTSSRICWRARPADRCGSYPITEFKATVRVAPGAAMGLGSDLGWMFNVSRRSAVGAVGSVSFDEGGLRFGGMARYRQWLGEASNVEIGLGSVLWGEELGYTVTPFSPSVALDWNPSPYAGVFARVDGVRATRFVGCYYGPDYFRGSFCSQPTRTDVAVYLGAKLGAQPGAATSVVAAMVLTVFAFIALAHAD